MCVTAWNRIPDSILLQIFSHLNAPDLLAASVTCKSWSRVSNDEFLWKDLLHSNWNIRQSVDKAPNKTSWKLEYIRLSYEVPSELVQTLSEHSNQVLHVSFSNDGEFFSTCSKDNRVILWEANYPIKMKYEHNMSDHKWIYCQYSQFNASDTLLLVSGVTTSRFSSEISSSSGEIVVFNIVDGFFIQCRVPNRPYDVFGSWYNDNYLLAVNYHFLQDLISCSTIWLNKAWQEADSENKPVLKRLFKFENRCASAIRCIHVARYHQICENSPSPGNPTSSKAIGNNQATTKGNPISRLMKGTGDVPTISAAALHSDQSANSASTPSNAPNNQSLSEKSANNDDDDDSDVSMSFSSDDETNDSDIEDHSVTYYISKRKNICRQAKNHDGILETETKLMIFTTGSKTYSPHQVGFKIIKPFRFAENAKNSLSLLEILRKRKTNQIQNNASDIMKEFCDPVDHIVEFDGHIIGLALSPDHRYLYVNCRPWPEGAIIEDPLHPPAIAEQIEIHVIDLMSFKKVGHVFRSHKAMTPNNECFFIFLSVSDDYVASGAENCRGYVWDRHYGILLNKFMHKDVVNCVAFNPKDPEMLVTVSDDQTIKVWYSKQKVKELGVATSCNIARKTSIP